GEQDPRLAPAPTGGSKRRLQRLGHLAQLRAARLELLRHGLQPLRILLFGHAQRKARRLGLLLLQLPQIRHGGILRRYRENRAALGAEASVRLGKTRRARVGSGIPSPSAGARQFLPERRDFRQVGIGGALASDLSGEVRDGVAAPLPDRQPAATARACPSRRRRRVLLLPRRGRAEGRARVVGDRLQYDRPGGNAARLGVGPLFRGRTLAGTGARAAVPGKARGCGVALRAALRERSTGAR